jgi:hypothetical protein
VGEAVKQGFGNQWVQHNMELAVGLRPIANSMLLMFLSLFSITLLPTLPAEYQSMQWWKQIGFVMGWGVGTALSIVESMIASCAAGSRGDSGAPVAITSCVSATFL